MVAISGLIRLPISVDSKQAAVIFRKLATVTSENGRLDEKFKRSVLKPEFITPLALKESVHSTRIEGTQVTFMDMIENSPSDFGKLNKDKIEVLSFYKHYSWVENESL